MAIIIGAGTTVGGTLFDSQCVTSVSWVYNPNVQRIYCLGSWSVNEERTIRKPTMTLNVTLFSSGTTPTYDTRADQTCTTTNQVSASVNPADRDGSVESLDFDNWVVTSYGYNKGDPQQASQETWDLQRWAETGDPGVPAGKTIIKPTYLIRGIAEGSVNEEVEAEAGIEFDPDGVQDSGNQGSVSAGALGNADITKTGVVVQVGQSSFVHGHTGTGSVSMPYTPWWM